MTGLLAYYSSATGNTHAFVQRLESPLYRIERGNCHEMINAPFVLVVPTYADATGRGAVPKAVIHFLNEAPNRAYIRGIIAGGNRNFGHAYALAGDIIAQKCNVPLFYRFELRGSDDDVVRVKQGLEKFWKHIS